MDSVGLDTETVGFEGSPYVVTAFRREEGSRIWHGSLDVQGNVTWTSKQIDDIQQFIDGCRVITHNGFMFDAPKLEAIGVTVNNLHDTMLASHVCNSQDPRGLKELAYQYLGISDRDEAEMLEQCREARRLVKQCKRIWAKGELPSDSHLTWPIVSKLKDIELPDEVKGSMWLLPLIYPNSKTHDKYAGCDAWRTWALWEGHGKFPGYYHIMKECGYYSSYNYLRNICEPLTFMQDKGVTVDTTASAELITMFTNEAIEIAQWYLDIYNINIRGNDLRNLFFDVLDAGKYSTKMGKTGKSLDKAALKNMVEATASYDPIHQHAQKVLDYRALNKKAEYATQYIEKSDGNGILHFSFNPVGTATCRRSSSRPNVQNITGELRRMFVPRDGYVWVLIDYSNLELRLFAWLAQEPTLLEWFKQGVDVHQRTGDSVATTLAQSLPPCELRAKVEAAVGTKEIRTVGKLQNFTLLYGGGAAKLAQLWLVHADIIVPDPKAVLDAHYETFPGIKEYTTELTRSLHYNRGRVYNGYGYPLVPPPDRPYACVDFVVQGTAGQLAGRALTNAYNMLKNEGLLKVAYPVLEVHDEIIFEVQQQELTAVVPMLKAVMEDNGLKGCQTPVDINICEWHWNKEMSYADYCRL